MIWDRLAAVVTAPRSWVLALLIAVASGLLLGLAGSNDAASQSPIALPSSAESARAAEAASAGVVVRPFAGEGIRVSVGEPEATDLFCEIAAGWREGL